MTTKIVFIGKPEVGKTTIKKVIFENLDPYDLMLFPLEATIGIKYSVHKFMDMEISLIDTPGQSMPILLEDQDKQINVFGNAHAIIYFFDYVSWIAQPDEIINNIKKILNIIKVNNFNAKIYLFLHKMDLINRNLRENLNVLKTQILNRMDLKETLPFHFTSLHPNLIYSLYNALSETLGKFLPDISNLKDVISSVISRLSKTIGFVIHQNNSIVIQVMTEDFDTSIIHQFYEKVNNLSKASENKFLKKNSFNLIDCSSKIFLYNTVNLTEFYPNLKIMITFSETLQKNDLSDLMNELKKILYHH